jgi:hypothetical protein
MTTMPMSVYVDPEQCLGFYTDVLGLTNNGDAGREPTPAAERGAREQQARPPRASGARGSDQEAHR